jgi:preprotein translocase subunit SecA
MPNIITQLTELREKATQGEWSKYYNDSDRVGVMQLLDAEGNELLDNGDTLRNAEYIVAYHNAFPELKLQSEAMEIFVEAIRKEKDDMDCCDNYVKSCSHDRIFAALAEYEESIKQEAH